MKFIKDIIGEKREQGPLSPTFEGDGAANSASERDVLTAILAESRAKSQNAAPAPLTLEPAARVAPEAQAAIQAAAQSLSAEQQQAPQTPQQSEQDILAALLSQQEDVPVADAPEDDTPKDDVPVDPAPVMDVPDPTAPQSEADAPDGVERPYRIFTRRNRTKMLQLEAAAKAASNAREADAGATVADSLAEVPVSAPRPAPEPAPEPAPAPEVEPQLETPPDAWPEALPEDPFDDNLIAGLMEAQPDPEPYPDSAAPASPDPEPKPSALSEGPVLGATFPEPAFADTAAAAGVDLGLPMGRAGRVKTRLLGFDGDLGVGDPFAQPGTSEAPSVSQFPVGWLVVVEGPGRGAGFTLFAGVSVIGRGEGQTVRLDFGDSSISRDQHAAIAYDPEQQGFFIGHGGKANLVRLNGRPVLSTEVLGAGDLIRVGETTLRFVPLCGPEFSWQGQGGTRGAHFG